MRFRVEAVYQRTVAELIARGRVLWLIFTPLARDATVQAMRGVLAMIRGRVREERERGDILTAMLVMAELDPWGHNLREELRMMLEAGEQEFIMKSKTLREAFEKGAEKGAEQVLRDLFVKRVGRALTAAEQETLAARTQTLGTDQVGSAVLRLEGDALVEWLTRGGER